ncbi:hypothetical protein [Bacillus chungangensis]|uniref:Uncharacterized protein n=1 Tax=Bacillus chungangensis TaxID=587633 RepID=A0ABT9WTK7_9BACI|nr:hypothetical protein [Bacillus chungangensis]MDQ0176449.1 hypothetical protein [Bacillus chungangensis]
MEQRNSFLEVRATKEEVDVKRIRKNFNNILAAYNQLDNAEKENQLLRNKFDEIVLDILEKGTKSKEPKLQLEPTLSFQFWQGIAE